MTDGKDYAVVLGWDAWSNKLRDCLVFLLVNFERAISLVRHRVVEMARSRPFDQNLVNVFNRVLNSRGRVNAGGGSPITSHVRLSNKSTTQRMRLVNVDGALTKSLSLFGIPCNMFRLASLILFGISPATSLMAISSEMESAFHNFRRHVIKEHRLLEDEYMDHYDDDQGGNGNGFDMSCDFDDNMEMSCSFTFQSDVLSMEMVCSFSYDVSVMYCNTCSTEYNVYNDDGSQVEFCYDSTCAVDGMGDTDLEEYCTCTGATVNDVACDYCAFCKTDDASYDIKEASQSGAMAYGMALQCPSAPESFLAETDCPAAALGRSSGAMIFVAVAGALALVAIVGYHVATKFTKKPQGDKETPFVQMNDEVPKGVVA